MSKKSIKELPTWLAAGIAETEDGFQPVVIKIQGKKLLTEPLATSAGWPSRYYVETQATQAFDSIIVANDPFVGKPVKPLKPFKVVGIIQIDDRQYIAASVTIDGETVGELETIETEPLPRRSLAVMTARYLHTSRCIYPEDVWPY